MSESNDNFDSYMTQKKDHRVVDDTVLEGRKDDCLLFIMKKGVAYPTEIARDLDLHIDSTNSLLYQLNKLQFIEKIHPDPINPQPMFRERMSELWMKGVWGYERFTQFSWWIITRGGFEYCRVKFKGQGKQASKSLVEWLDLKLAPEAEIKEVGNGTREDL